jgi:phosphatidylserine decarboxylase
MALIESLRLVLAPPHRAGTPFIAAGVAVALGGLFLHGAVTAAGLTFTLFCLYFFRDPVRVRSPVPGAILAPADGKIVSIMLAVPPAELGLGAEPRWRVAIFLSVLNVHVNRMPADGVVSKIAYHAGRFLNASVDKASEENERNAVALRLADGRDMAVVQIAGLIARRILCDVREGDRVTGGDRFGIIRFGSRTDLYLPHGIFPTVAVGQTAVGGETVLAMLGA